MYVIDLLNIVEHQCALYSIDAVKSIQHNATALEIEPGSPIIDNKIIDIVLVDLLNNIGYAYGLNLGASIKTLKEKRNEIIAKNME